MKLAESKLEELLNLLFEKYSAAANSRQLVQTILTAATHQRFVASIDSWSSLGLPEPRTLPSIANDMTLTTIVSTYPGLLYETVLLLLHQFPAGSRLPKLFPQK